MKTTTTAGKLSKQVNGTRAGEAGANGSRANGARSAKSGLPRKLASASLRKRNKLAVVFQGGSAAVRMEKANLLADHLALKQYRVDLRPFISRFIGETEKNLDRIFDSSPPGETLLYFDEADMLFDREHPDKGSSSRFGNGWISYFNKRLRDFQGSVLLATNLHSRSSKISAQLKPLVARIQ
jgi:hypothetical protein